MNYHASQTTPNWRFSLTNIYEYVIDKEHKTISWHVKDNVDKQLGFQYVRWQYDSYAVERHKASVEILTGKWTKEADWRYINKKELAMCAQHDVALMHFVKNNVSCHFDNVTINHKKQTITFKDKNHYIKCRLHPHFYCDSLNEKSFIKMMVVFAHHPSVIEYCSELWKLDGRKEMETSVMSYDEFVHQNIDGQMREALIISKNLGIPLKDQKIIGQDNIMEASLYL